MDKLRRIRNLNVAKRELGFRVQDSITIKLLVMLHD